jgi:hypothetical protein
MNKKIFLPVVALCSLAALTGCDENDWNNKLDGFDSTFNPTEEKSVEYTLTDADYASIAANATNKALAAEADASQALSALSSNKYFTDKITADQYVPAFLASTSSPFYTLTDGSSVKLTYNVAVGLPDEVTEAAGATQLTVSSDYYKTSVWESDENYIDAFAPENPASKFLPNFLKASIANPTEGQYAIVSYNEATQNPIFGGVETGGTTTEFTLSNVIGDIAAGDGVTIDGVVAGACTCGFVLTDQGGSIFVYMGSSYDMTTYPVGTQLHLEGSATSYKNNLQIATGSEITVMGTQAYTYPAPVVYDGAALDAVLSRPADQTAIYATISGNVVLSGTNINIEVAGAETAKGSVYYPTDAQREQFTDGATVKLTGWFISISGSRYCNFIIDQLEVNPSAAAMRRRVPSRTVAAPVPSTEYNAVYQWDGAKWSVPANFVVLNPADYTAMGLSYLSAPNNYLPTFLKQKYPYAQADDSKFVLYRSSNTAYSCANYVFNGSEWVLNNGIETQTSQFVRSGGKWMFDPNLTITLPAGKNQPVSTTYYQACVDWVYENKCVPLGDTSIKSGAYWVTSYGNNEYYSGASAYQGNVDLRPASARAQYSAGWEGYTDDEIVALMEERFAYEVFPAVLSQFYPSVKPLDGFDVIYTLNFYAYNGSKTLPCKAEFKVVAQGQFECISAEWFITE